MLIDGKLTGLQALKMSYVARDKQHIVFRKIMEGKLDTAHKLRAFVERLLQVEEQGSIFELQILSPEERESISDFNSLLKSAERFISACFDEGRVNHLKKGVFHEIDVARLDLVISSLMKLRKTVLSGKGLKDAFEETSRT